ncbi:MogA/MoaB family molybdenum cofactor biosynthesis protein [Symbiobacterium thermophilum]|uniref:Molybdenum cofactor biosynthesis protein B n=2 Tax=Symbiobacterium thermophilum TaxID=2734 RepID=Q67NZ6_SYMTH|nr:MogA/MoaB family molybdenum cofactor biosynthesis protein [Symbiobacterium thermophilum]MBY6276489.1 molybdenum cofactor biosynthesis protein [Symbiobacterium thermophilum]BAD40597.1 molybdopterin precursor biosynthesis protein [Symbiobacterium thermophilum IAM 14863]
MGVHDHKEEAARAVGQLTAGIVTVSDTRTAETDESGQLLRELLTGAGHRVEAYAIVPDEVEAIRSAVVRFAERVDFVVVNGGTGMTPRDVTIEACRPLFSKELEGFGELFRMLSYQEIGSAAVMSRAAAGAVGRVMLFCLPGSKGAVRLATERLILPEIRHLVSHIRKR